MKRTDDKVQTGLRIPAKRYAELNAMAESAGVSLNSLILVLVDLGLAVHNGPIFIQKESK